MIRILGSVLLIGTLYACGVAEEDPYRRYYPQSQYRPTGGDPNPGGDPGVVADDCGNGIIDAGEACDRALALTETCQSLGYASGTLRCSASCALDTSNCQALETCNNGQLDTLEACEGYELRGETCVSQGFTGGTLRCSPACVLDTSQCTLCGNGILETGEVCDSTEFGGKTCATEVGSGYVGALSCQSTCSYVSTSACEQAASRDEQCYDGLACLDQYTCDMVYADPAIAACKLRCSQPGTTGGCTGGETCFDSGWVELQNETEISCAGPSDCNAAQGYDCLPTNQGDLCAREIAWCGTTVEWVSDYSSTEAIQAGPTCNEIFGHAMCRTPAVATDPAEVICVPLEETGDGVCLTFCENEEGDLSCGAGFECAVPAATFYYMVQRDDLDNEIYCTVGDDTPCDVTGGYACTSLNSGDLCARPAKACVPL